MYSKIARAMRYHKYGETAFLTSRNENERIFGSRVDLTVRDDGKNPRDRSYTPHRYKSLVSPSLTRCQANAVEIATKVCYFFFLC